MTARASAFVLALLLPLPAAAQQRSAERPASLSVTYRSETAVYVSGGRAAGLAVGDRLAVMSGSQQVAELEVVFLAEHSSSCRVVSQQRAVKSGDRVVRLGAPRPAPPPAAAGPEITTRPGTGTTTATPGPVAPPARPPQSRFGRLTGGVSAGYSTFRDNSESGRNVRERLTRFDLALRDMAAGPFEARLRGSGRQIERDRIGGDVAPASETRQRLYEASVSWAPPDGMFAARAGRLGAHPFVSLGYLDGVVAEVRPAAGVQVGAFGGRSPDALDAGAPAGAKYGAFLRLGSALRGSGGELVLSGAREMAGSEISREYVGQQAQARVGPVWLYERVEIDLNRGWRRERAAGSAQLSDARLLASWRASPDADFSVSYERRQGFWSAFTRSVPGELFDQRVHQALRTDLHLTRRGGLGLSAGASARVIDGDDRTAWAVYGGVRSPRLLSLGVSVDGSYFDSLHTRGLLATARAGRSLRRGHRLEGSYTFSRYDLAGGNWRLGHWVRLSGYGQVLRRAFARGDVEYAIQDELPGLRVLVEAGYRF